MHIVHLQLCPSVSQLVSVHTIDIHEVTVESVSMRMAVYTYMKITASLQST
jgi:hypothetical protein